MKSGTSAAQLRPFKILRDLTGQVFGRYTVVRYLGADQRWRRKWFCSCACGATREVWEQALLRGVSQSCGCLHREKVAAKQLRHGHTVNNSHSPEYRSWQGMLARCRNPENPRWAAYGGRGISVHLAWVESFEQFLADMGPRPRGTSIDREDNDGNYEPGNCRWATPVQQQRNRSCTTRLTFRGETLSLHDWAERLGIDHTALSARIRRGWSVERALTQPVQGRSQ